MCGIFGIVRRDGGKPEEEIVRKATDSMEHRGPDASGFFFFKNAALGNRRLAIFDLDPRANQPFQKEYLVITFNGALYNYLEIKEELIEKGVEFKSSSDTEVVLAAYQYWGAECVQKFNGMWAFAIIDQKKNQIFCARDRFGIKPFFYTEQDEKLVFASEIKAFKTLPNWNSSLNHKAASAYLNQGKHFYDEETLYKNLYSLPAGHTCTIDLSHPNIVPEEYYSIDRLKVNNALSFEAAKDQFKSLFEAAVRLHSRSDVEIGAALSGGLDSSILVAQLANETESSASLNTITYQSSIAAYDESRFAKLVSDRYKTKAHLTSTSFEETMQLMDEVIIAHDGPLLSASLVAQYLVFKKAKELGIKVMLDGQGADELLAGYGTYYPSYLKYVLANHPMSFPLESARILKKHNISGEKIKRILGVGHSIPKLFNFEINEGAAIPENFGAYEKYMITQGILPYLLQYEDRNAMAHGVESRVPFLDYRLVEFCLQLPPTFKINKGIRKHLLRESMKTELPKAVYKRYDKMGFSTPQTDWMATHADYFMSQLKKYCEVYPKLLNRNILNYAKEGMNNKSVEVCNLVWRTCSFFRWMEINEVVC